AAPALDGGRVMREARVAVMAVILDRFLRDAAKANPRIQQPAAQVRVFHAAADDALVVAVHAQKVIAMEREIAAQERVAIGGEPSQGVQRWKVEAVAPVARIGVLPPEAGLLDAPRAHVVGGEPRRERGIEHDAPPRQRLSAGPPRPMPLEKAMV